MKTLRSFILVTGLFLTSLALFSCMDDDDNDIHVRFPNATVTVKPTGNNSFYLQLDDSTTLFPVNMATPPFGTDKEQRALINFTRVNKPSEGYSQAIHINWIDSMLTKPMAENLGEKNDSIYGIDPVELVRGWVFTEDGYLTVCFHTLFGGQKPHFVNLIKSDNSENPYEVEFRHHAYDDPEYAEANGIVSFKLDSLPDTEGKTVNLKIKYKSFSGDKSVEVKYNTRKSVGEKPEVDSRNFSKVH